MSERITGDDRTTAEDRSGVRSWTGLDLFSDDTPPGARRRYVAHALVYVVSMLLVIWPLLLPFNRVEPYVLGLPFVMFWSSLSIVVVLVNTILLYRFDHGAVTKRQ